MVHVRQSKGVEEKIKKIHARKNHWNCFDTTESKKAIVKNMQVSSKNHIECAFTMHFPSIT